MGENVRVRCDGLTIDLRIRAASRFYASFRIKLKIRIRVRSLVRRRARVYWNRNWTEKLKTFWRTRREKAPATPQRGEKKRKKNWPLPNFISKPTNR